MNYNLFIPIIFISLLGGNILFRLVQSYYQSSKLTLQSHRHSPKIRAREISWGKVKVIISPFLLVEVIYAFSFSLIYYIFGPSWLFIDGTLLFSVLFYIAIIDIDTHTIPDTISIGGMMIFFIYRVYFHEIGYSNIFYGFIINILIFSFLAIISKGAMGGGDIRLAALIGIFLGWQGGLLAVGLAFFFGSLGGILLLVFKKGQGKTVIPFGPFLGMGGVLSFIYSGKMLGFLLS